AIVVIFMKFLNGGFDEAHAAVVTMEALVLEEGVDAIKACKIAVGGDNFKMRAFPQADGGAKVPDDKGDGFAEVPVGWIADEPGTRIRVGSDNHVGLNLKSMRANLCGARGMIQEEIGINIS